MREILFDLTEDSYVPKIAFGGFEGEHNATRLSLRLPERLICEGAKYYMVFETKGDEMIFSAPLLLEENTITALLPKQVMTSPDVTVHAAAYRSEGEELIEIAKSPRVILEVKCPEAEGQRELSDEGGEIPGLVIEAALLPESDNPVSSRALYGELSALEGEGIQSAFVNQQGELVLKKKNRTLFTAGSVVGPRGEKGDQGERGDKGEQGEKGDVGAPDYSLVANALRGKTHGTAVAMTEVSPLEHEIRVKLERSDATAPYYKYDFNGDGSVTEEDASHLLNYVNFPEGASDLPWWTEPDVDGDGNLDMDDAIALLDAIADGEAWAFEKADVFSSVTLKKLGKNLLPYPYVSTTNDRNGITWTDNGDGTISGVGTPTAAYTAGFVLSKDESLFKDGCTYTLSAGGGFDCYIQYNDESGNTFFVRSVDWKAGYKFTGLYLQAPKIQEYNGVAYPQLEIGATETEYEPYKAPEIVPVGADGTATIYGKGESISLMTDTADVTLEAEYNKDLVKVIDRLEKALKGGI